MISDTDALIASLCRSAPGVSSPDLIAAADLIAAYREALEWYAEKVAGCRKITSEGNDARNALDRDGGEIARRALGRTEGDKQ